MASQSLTRYRSCPLEPFRIASPFLAIYRQAGWASKNVYREFDNAREALGSVVAPSIGVTQSGRPGNKPEFRH